MNARPQRARRAVAAALAATLVWMDLSAVVHAAPTDIADVPIATRGRAKPNMILAIDDSGSMDYEFLPTTGASTNDGAAWWNTRSRSFFGFGTNGTDDLWQGGGTTPVVGGSGFFGTTPPRGPLNFNTTGAGSAQWRKYTYLFPNGQCGSNCDTRSYVDGASDSFAVPPTREFGWTRSARFNAQYYNPAIRYDAWRPYNDGGSTVAPPSYDGSAGAWERVRSHPVYPLSGTGETINLTAETPVPGDANAANRVFTFFTGMILPGNVRYRICNHDNTPLTIGASACDAWVTDGVTADRCIVSVDTQDATHCHYASAYGVSQKVVAGIAGGQPRRIEAQIPYRAATYWVPSNAGNSLDANEAYGPDGSTLRRVEILPGSTYAKAATRTDCSGSVCTYEQELTNFANWWAYYRKRHMMLNAALGFAFDEVSGLRSGAFLFNNRTDVVMRDFDRTSDAENGRRLLYDLYRSKGTSGTPTRASLEFAGRQFERTDGNAPIQAECQFNAAFVITDGFARNNAPSGNYGNADADGGNRFTVPFSPANPALNYAPSGVLPAPPAPISSPPTVTPGAPFADTEDNTLADVAMHFYSTNLRPDLPIRQVPVNRNDESPAADRNDFLHMNTFALGLGVQGVIFGRTDTAEAIRNNDDPYTITSWPAVRSGGGYVFSPATIDELWHATVNGRGKMLSATSPEETRLGVIDIVNNVGARGGAGAAVAVANPNVTPGDNFSYASSYNSGSWSGDLNKFEIDVDTGIVSASPLWSPSPQQRIASTPPGNRVIVTYNDAVGQSLGANAGIPFRWASLTSDQQSKLTSTLRGVTAPDSEVLDFLRGERSREGDKFRSRGARPLRDANGNFIVEGGRYRFAGNTIPRDIAVLGDIVNAEPVVVRQPRFSYFDPGYQEYRAANASRAPVLYQGANDGMLHAFSVLTGEELWAYVPYLVYDHLPNLADRATFRHKYAVDGTPTVGDVDFANTRGTTGTPDWRTVLVGSLRKGGYGYYALDVTTGDAGSETTVANRVLWEFPSRKTDLDAPFIRPNVGYSFGRPVIAKTRAAGWVVIVSSGYNNGSATTGGDGRGRIFVLDPRDGSLIREIDTLAGTPDNPSGLAHLSAFARRPDVDATIEAVYGGDLLGNVWRFDLSGDSTASWSVTKLAQLTDAGGRAQPVTSEPELGIAFQKRVIFVATGRYLGESDALNTATTSDAATQTQTVYALRDDLVPGGTSTPQIPTPTRDQLVARTASKSGDSITVSGGAVDFRSNAGWYLDLPESGERVVSNPVLSGGVLTFISIIPDNANQCSPGGSAWAWFLDYASGSLVIGSTSAGIRIGNVLASRAVLIRVRDGIVGIVRTTGGAGSATGGQETLRPPVRPGGSAGRRVSWREVLDGTDP